MIPESCVQPTREEIEAHRRKMSEYFKKERIAAGVGLVFSLGALVFLPALGGGVVCFIEVERQILQGDLESDGFHSKYPDLDRSECKVV